MPAEYFRRAAPVGMIAAGSPETWMYAAKTMMLDLTDLSRRADVARGYVPLRSAELGRGRRGRRALLIAISIASCSGLLLVALLFLSAILDL